MRAWRPTATVEDRPIHGAVIRYLPGRLGAVDLRCMPSCPVQGPDRLPSPASATWPGLPPSSGRSRPGRTSPCLSRRWSRGPLRMLLPRGDRPSTGTRARPPIRRSGRRPWAYRPVPLTPWIPRSCVLPPRPRLLVGPSRRCGTHGGAPRGRYGSNGSPMTGIDPAGPVGGMTWRTIPAARPDVARTRAVWTQYHGPKVAPRGWHAPSAAGREGGSSPNGWRGRPSPAVAR